MQIWVTSVHQTLHEDLKLKMYHVLEVLQQCRDLKLLNDPSLADRRIFAWRIAETLQRFFVFEIHDQLRIQKSSTKRASECLNNTQKWYRYLTCHCCWKADTLLWPRDNNKKYWEEPSCFPQLKNFHTKKSEWNDLVIRYSFLGGGDIGGEDKECILITDYHGKDYVNVCWLNEALKEKRRMRFRVEVLFKDSVPPDKAGKALNILKSLQLIY